VRKRGEVNVRVEEMKEKEDRSDRKRKRLKDDYKTDTNHYVRNSLKIDNIE
jgi:hypothetical protein